MFVIVAAIGKNGELGKSGDLVWHLADDMRFFRQTTSGGKVLMGRRTWESLPVRKDGFRKLADRWNIVVADSAFEGDFDELVTDLDGFIAENRSSSERIFVIGGGSIYEQLLPFAREIYLTEIKAEDNAADVYFAEFNKSDYDREILGDGVDEKSGIKYEFVKYLRKDKI
ncbi:MAG: dihydrofolate reductase [Candidatus Nomurabacteria bacterium]|jgi:dihydrofolate reductase|nr:dihydrofolate reductase [Candidatus Nomurabacteria bacterium]